MVDVIIIRNADEETIKRILKTGRAIEDEKEIDYDEKIVDEKPTITIDDRKKLMETNWKQKIITPTKRLNHWTEQENELIKECYTKNSDGRIDWKILLETLTNRTKDSITHHAAHIGLANRHRKRTFTNRPNRKSSIKPIIMSNNKIDGRGKKRIFSDEDRKKALLGRNKYTDFMKKRVNEYENYGSNKSDAYHLSLTDWKRFKKGEKIITIATTTNKQITPKKEVKIIEEFPTFQTINKEFGILIENMAKHIIANKGSRLNYLNTKEILDIENGRVWHDFVVEFLAKSNKIAEYFNVPNKFKHVRTNDGYDLIEYD